MSRASADHATVITAYLEMRQTRVEYQKQVISAEKAHRKKKRE
jgi:hypothetical protein